MSLTITLLFTLTVIIGFFSTKKTLHNYEQFFLFFIIIFLYTSYTSILYVNLEQWTVSKKVYDIIAFFIFGNLFFPFCIIWFIDLWHHTFSIIKRTLFFIGLLALFTTLELFFTFTQVINYIDWNIGKSIIAWIIFITISYNLVNLFHSLLKREGGEIK